MSQGLNIAQPVSSAITGVEFGFMSSEEIRALSVKRITNPTTFDTLLNPVPGGLYDAALGAFLDNPCATCNLQKFNCPGHCGHIELPVPVYHPTFMDQLLRLIRAQCVYCHHLKMSRSDVNRFSCKLRLIQYGLLKEAQELEDVASFKWSNVDKGVEKRARKEEGEDVDSASEGESNDDNIIAKREAFVKRAIKNAGVRKSGWTVEKTEAVNEERRFVIKEFLMDINKGKKCKKCGGISPTYRKAGYVKIFRKPLSAKDKATMIQSGKKIEDPIVAEMARRKEMERADQKYKPHLDEGVEMEEDEEEGEDVMSIDADEEIADGSALAMEAATMTADKNKKLEDGQTYMSVAEVYACLQWLFEKEQDILSHVYGPRSRGKNVKVTADMFFIKTLIVAPNKYRPEAKTGKDEIAEAQRNSLYKNILTICDIVNQIVLEIKGVPTDSRRPRTFDDLRNVWVDLQNAVNSLIDRDRNPIQGAAGKKNEDGIKQKLEKKEGLFRKNMMGKRVNFAARSVISPDPNIETNEIGVPPVFAIKLTYPEPVTNHNYYELKEAVLNGPDKWPGAVAIENENGQVVNLKTKNYEERQALANQLLSPSSTAMTGTKNKKVYRHLNNGDVVIMNRQPTLHKPSMMAHRARVLPGEKTIRMHYANCNTYNADFDGDEMNMHFPQNEVARAEAVSIADTDHQYLSATAGAPLRGLIQDHISMGVQLTNKDTFFTREDYHQLLYACLRPEHNHTTSSRLITVPPTVFKPKPLWTGKQIITTVLMNIKPETHVGLTFQSKSSTSSDRWHKGSEEGNVIFKDGELLCGIMDKKQIGPSGGGLINATYEAYGHTLAGKLLSALGRLLTKMLHMRAFSCGVEDLVLTPDGDKLRKEKLQDANHVGLRVAAKYVSLEDQKPDSNSTVLKSRLEEVLRDDAKQHGLDQITNQNTAQLSSSITNACLPAGLVKPFPKNQMQAMTGSGAKGSQVNANLISCNLGQQVLEGRRVPIMVSGKSLPCFKPFESSVRAGGYIVDRFLTGIRPQEYYFHAMAGREGLIDTAVKTSRSGYLQRCLIKGMEGLRVEYDTTVRDSDGSMVQFLYGEDGLDPTKEKYLNDFKFTAENFQSVFNSLGIRGQFAKLMNDEAAEWNKTAVKKYKKTGDLGCVDPAISVFAPGRHAGSTSERFFAAKKKYCDDNPDKLLKSKKQGTTEGLARKTFDALLDAKYLKSIVEPGEAVGVVAGQSIGEPSTQMTLNTFHLAGHSAKNVTLGIPRLREIVMTASAAISTPSMTLHVNPEISKTDAERFAKGISRLSLAEVVDKASVTESLGRGIAYDQAKMYKIKLDFFAAEDYCKEYAIVVNDVLMAIERKFVPRLQKLVRDELKKKGQEKSLKANAKTDAIPEIGVSAGTTEQEAARPEGMNEGGDDDNDDDGDDDATNAKQKANRSENASYEKPDDDEETIAAQGRARDATPEPMEEDETYGGSPRASDEDSDEESSKKLGKSGKSAADRESRIMDKNQDVTSFKIKTKKVDGKTFQTCEFTMEYDAQTAKLLMLHIVEKACRDAVVQAIPGLNGCLATTDKDAQVVITEGVNLLAMHEYQDMINPHKIFTNDIAAMLRLYGVEACRANIVREMSAVFGGHGISVDNRHLNLIADTMTRGGGYTAFNRMGLKSNVSPFMKMSFETTVGFLKDAVLEEDWDDLDNPSARIVVGKMSKVGTGAFDVLMPVA